MQFANLVQQYRTERTESPDDPKSVIAIEDALQDPSLNVNFVLDEDTRTLMLIEDEYLTEDDVVLELPQYPGAPEPLWVLTREIGIVNRHTATMSIAEFGDCFLVALHRGALAVRVEGNDPVLLTESYSGEVDMDTDVTWFTPDTLPSAPYKRKGHHGFFNIRYKLIDYGHYDVSVLRWKNQGNIETVMFPKFYERLEQERKDRERVERERIESERLLNQRKSAARQAQAILSSLGVSL